MSRLQVLLSFIVIVAIVLPQDSLAQRVSCNAPTSNSLASNEVVKEIYTSSQCDVIGYRSVYVIDFVQNVPGDYKRVCMGNWPLPLGYTKFDEVWGQDICGNTAMRIIKNEHPDSNAYHYTTEINTPITASGMTTDPDGDTLTYSTSNSSLELNRNTGEFTYTPPDNWIGEVSFSLIARDGKGGSASILIYIDVEGEVVNYPPVLQDKHWSTNQFLNIEQDLGKLTAFISAEDPEGDEIISHKPDTSEFPLNGYIEEVEASYGTAYLYRPNIGFFGEDQVIIKAVDEHGNAGFGTMYINVFKTVDTDDDGLPDYYETEHSLLINDASDALADPDGDGLNNLGEYQAGTGPHVPDSDGDLIPDGFEVEHSNALDPLDNTDASLDFDNDGYSNFTEYEAGTLIDDASSYPGSDQKGWLVPVINYLLLN